MHADHGEEVNEVDSDSPDLDLDVLGSELRQRDVDGTQADNYTITIDLAGPNAPNLDEVGSGEGRLSVNWEEPTDPSDVFYVDSRITNTGLPNVGASS